VPKLQIYQVSCIREHAQPPLGAALSSSLVSEKLWCCRPRTGELAKGSVAVQAKARFTLETDELHKPVDTHALHAAISKQSPLTCREQASSSDSRLRITSPCYHGPGCSYGRSGGLFWVASSCEGFTCWPWPASVWSTCLIAVDCYSALSLTQGSPTWWYRMMQLARTVTIVRRCTQTRHWACCMRRYSISISTRSYDGAE
jgi:hypothetical protein